MVHRTGSTQRTPIPQDVNTHRLKDLISEPEGHIVYVITIRNPSNLDRNGQAASAGTLWAGAEGNPDMDLAVGASNDWYFVDPGKFALACASVAGVVAIVDVSGCAEFCPKCQD
jgi:hypothetical protein